MLTREENEMLTRVGPGTPAGELLRRYWLPVGVASELTDENPTQLVRILGETLVLFRDKKGNVGLLDDRCAHRGATVQRQASGNTRQHRCVYHQWCYNSKGELTGVPYRRGVTGMGGYAADFDTKTIVAYFQEYVRIYHPGDFLDGGEVLPGFSAPVDDLFP